MNKTNDLALLRYGEGHSPKVAYDLSRSDVITEEFLAAEIGTASFILGVWGEETRAFPYPDGLLYLEDPLYSCVGPLVEVGPRAIVADMAEKEILLRTQKLPRLANVVATGGRRDLSGISGSGLWMLRQARPVLVGIVLGPNEGEPDQHLIRATPAWVLREWINELSK